MPTTLKGVFQTDSRYASTQKLAFAVGIKSLVGIGCNGGCRQHQPVAKVFGQGQGVVGVIGRIAGYRGAGLVGYGLTPNMRGQGKALAKVKVGA